MMKLGTLSIDPVALGSQGNAVLGIRGSGKTYTATLLAEMMHDHGIPFVAFDPVGVWRFLRVPGHGKGYPIVVAGGVDGDLPLTVASAPEIVRAAMASGVSLVIDLFDINLSKADWKRIVTSCVKVLIHENAQHGLRHIFLEEAAEFAPQKVGPDQSHVYAEIEKLARMGGNSRLGYTLINQRSEEVAKAVLELCDNLFLHRQKGRNSLAALSKWLDIGNVSNFKEITASLSTLATGKCWAWLGESAEPVLITVPTKNSFHPDRTVMRGAETIKAKRAVDVGSFVETMKSGLAKFQAEADANDPKRLKARIAELEREKAKVVAPVVDETAIGDAWTEGYTKGTEEGFKSGMDSGIAAERQRLGQKVLDFAAQFALATAEASELPKTPAQGKPIPIRTIAPKVRMAGNPVQNVANSGKPAPKIAQTNGAGLPKSLQRCLNSIAWWKAIGFSEVSRDRASVVAGLSPTASTFGVYVSKLKDMGLVENGSAGCIKLTPEGEAHAEPPEVIDRKEVSRLAKEQVGGQAARVLELVLDAYPSPISRDDLADQMELSRTASTLGVYLSKSSKLGFVEAQGGGMVRAADWLFP